MKKVLSLMLVVALVIAFSAPAVLAAEKKTGKSEKNSGGKEQKSAQVTQSELAQLLIRVLGLARFLPAAPTDLQCYAILLANSISPKEGWDATKVVTKQDLARVIVQAMKKQSEIKDPDNPQEWMDYLKSIGVPLEAVGETVSYVDPLAEPVAPRVVAARVDPLAKVHKFNPIDETQYGVDMEFVTRVLSQLEFQQGEFRPIPLTPD